LGNGGGNKDEQEENRQNYSHKKSKSNTKDGKYSFILNVCPAKTLPEAYFL
jgi:hypothetical protein